ncbi:thiamine-phosphate kinase [Actinobaculum suis]|uniref:thiamine-phosphate kinase n=1 Tax=Actinobaculum suis TaxID=1657 RepID=UPI0008088154|nr:thiamine-phosphate kinase [Actinobaculum suis]OCA96053.1 thiamine-phosphate kinase [Actinobaculum suis]OCA96173.1 thiamine-phosphate kinase [Actinobaculum suis]
MFIRDLTEDALLARILPLLPRRRDRAHGVEVPTGDDCTVLRISDGKPAISTDMLVDGVHFRRDWSTGRDVGWRAAMQNIADAVAMGARPVSLLVSMQLPGMLPVAWVEDLARGMADACAPLGCGVDGGDLVSGETLTISVTVIGDLEGRAPLLRQSALPGEAVIHVGNIGHAAAGYELLRRGFSPQDSAFPNTETMLIDDFRRPKPPVEQALDAARAGALGAFMDVSDGLIRDLSRIAAASQVWIDIDTGSLEADMHALLPVARHLGRNDPVDWVYRCVLTGGEDHGFVGTLDRPHSRAWGARTPTLPDGFRRIGTVRDADPHGRITLDGNAISGLGGWDHFAKTAPLAAGTQQ